MPKPIQIKWLYPDILNLHGDRGNIMAWQHIGNMLGLETEIKRVDDLQEELDLTETDMLFLCPGEIKNMPKIIAALQRNSEQTEKFLAKKGYIFAIGNSGCILARSTTRYDKSSFAGLGLLPMYCQERKAVYGDDIWFRLPSGAEIIGNQIQVIDTVLEDSNYALGKLIYGYGNNKGANEGCRADNIIFTNTLGPLLVKNPRFAAEILADISQKKGIEPTKELAAADIDYEDKSFALIKSFIEKKMA